MIQARKLGHIVLKVRDAQASKEFYVRTLGLKVAYDDRDHEAALFQRATGEAPDPAQPGLHHTAWQVASFDDLQAAHHELRELGIAVDAIGHNVTRSIYFHDPDGNRVELYCDMVADGFEAMQRLGPRRDVLDIETGQTIPKEDRR